MLFPSFIIHNIAIFFRAFVFFLHLTRSQHLMALQWKLRHYISYRLFYLSHFFLSLPLNITLLCYYKSFHILLFTRLWNITRRVEHVIKSLHENYAFLSFISRSKSLVASLVWDLWCCVAEEKKKKRRRRIKAPLSDFRIFIMMLPHVRRYQLDARLFLKAVTAVT